MQPMQKLYMYQSPTWAYILFNTVPVTGTSSHCSSGNTLNSSEWQVSHPTLVHNSQKLHKFKHF